MIIGILDLFHLVFNFWKVDIIDMSKKINFSKSEIDSMVNLHYEGYTNEKISKFFNCSSVTIGYHLKKRGIQVKLGRKPKYYINDSYFESIDSNNKSYILGFLYADGCKNDDYTVTINTHKDDTELMKRFNKKLECSKPLEFYDNIVRFIIRNKKIVDNLTKFGVVKNKSRKIKFPYFINNNFYSHFIRGFFDGDGCVYYNKINKSLIFKITSVSKPFLLDIQKIIMAKCDLNKTKLYRQPNDPYVLRYSGNKQAKRIFDYMYKDADLYLKRKFNRFVKEA